MIDLFDIPEACRFEYSISVDKFNADNKDVFYNSVTDIKWAANINPQILGIDNTGNDLDVFKEMQVLCVSINNSHAVYPVARVILQSIKYPCILLIRYQDKFAICSGRITPYKRDFEKNSLKKIYISHWIHTDLVSAKADECIQKINCAFCIRSSIHDMYCRVRDAIESFELGGLSKSCSYEIIESLIGSCNDKEKQEILQYCTPYQYHSPSDDSIGAKYDMSKRSAQYTWIHDEEDLWYCFMRNNKTRSVIKGRRYESMEELLFRLGYDRW